MATVTSIAATETTSEPIPPTMGEPDGHYEVINGKFVEKPAMGVFEVWIASELFGWLKGSAVAKNHGRVVSEMLFRLDIEKDLKRRPDLAFVSFERWPKSRPIPRTTAWEIVPDLAIEVISPTNLAL
jgi:Uma2 family endonuclease